MSTIRLYLDEDVRPMLARALRERGFDVITTAEAGMIGKSDREQLEFASSQGRVLLTHNIRDFIQLAKGFAEEGRNHGGIVLAQQMPLKDLLRLTLRWLSQVSAASFSNSVYWLSASRK